MPVALPEIRVGDPASCGSLSVFPLFSSSVEKVDYRLSEPALADESLLVEEVDGGGSVSSLLVENKGDTRVLLLDAQELLGAKQNRILNTSVLVPARSKIKIPVSCVEQGRWRYKSRYFRASDAHSPLKLRQALRRSVTKAVDEKRGCESDQDAVWHAVAAYQDVHEVDTETAAMADAIDACQDQIEAYRSQLQYVRDASGIAVAIKNKVASIDLFDKPTTCQEVWGRMLSGVALDAIEAGEPEKVASIADVEQLIATALKLPWKQSKAVGEGEEFRASSDDGDLGSALVLDTTLVHGSILASA